MIQRRLNPWLLALLLAAPVSLPAQSTDGALAKSAILESNVAYLHVNTIGQDLPAEIQSAQQALSATNLLTGTVLDLRFAGGNDMDSAKAVVNLFLQEKLPVAILVNNETAGTAAQLASDLRAANAGLIFGSSKTLKPDISVPVSPDAEKKFMKNPFGTLSTNDVVTASETNDFLPYIDHTTEADLVREKIKDGDQEGDFVSSGQTSPEGPFIRDPVLARGIDFIKGLAALRQSHS
jgi:membrane-bound ClpP family serine protease